MMLNVVECGGWHVYIKGKRRNVPGVAVGIVRPVRPECARESARGMSTVLQEALYEQYGPASVHARVREEFASVP